MIRTVSDLFGETTHFAVVSDENHPDGELHPDQIALDSAIKATSNPPKPGQKRMATPHRKANPTYPSLPRLAKLGMLAEDAGQPSNWVTGRLVSASSPTGDWGWADPKFVYSIKSLFRKWEGEAPAEPFARQIKARQEPRPPENRAFGTDSKGCDPTTGQPVKSGATSGNPSCVMNCNNNAEMYSFHPGGVTTVFCDGSVHFLTQGISPATIAALVTKAGGEVLPADAF